MKRSEFEAAIRREPYSLSVDAAAAVAAMAEWAEAEWEPEWPELPERVTLGAHHDDCNGWAIEYEGDPNASGRPRPIAYARLRSHAEELVRRYNRVGEMVSGLVEQVRESRDVVRRAVLANEGETDRGEPTATGFGATGKAGGQRRDAMCPHCWGTSAGDKHAPECPGRPQPTQPPEGGTMKEPARGRPPECRTAPMKITLSRSEIEALAVGELVSRGVAHVDLGTGRETHYAVVLRGESWRCAHCQGGPVVGRHTPDCPTQRPPQSAKGTRPGARLPTGGVGTSTG